MIYTVIEVAEPAFDGFVKDNAVVVIDFWAPWCKPCLRMSPEVDLVAKKYAGKVVFGKVNIDEAKALMAKLEITAVPTILVYKDGKPLGTPIIGMRPASELEAQLKARGVI